MIFTTIKQIQKLNIEKLDDKTKDKIKKLVIYQVGKDVFLENLTECFDGDIDKTIKSLIVWVIFDDQDGNIVSIDGWKELYYILNKKGDNKLIDKLLKDIKIWGNQIELFTFVIKSIKNTK